jgi:SAM-dependent methyltransferase
MTKEKFWGRGATDWMEIQEPLHRPLYEATLDALQVRAGSTLLDAGCGSGIVSVLATQREAVVTGLDASSMFVDVARSRCPDAQFLIGDLQEALPFEADRFDAVVFSNSLQFVAKPIDAVREAARVLRVGGRVAIAVFDSVERCDGAKPIGAILSLLPAPPAGAPGPFALSSARILGDLIGDAGLRLEGILSVDTPWHYRDRETALRALMSAGPSHQAREIAGEERLRDALDAAISPFRQADGSYRMQNIFIVGLGRKT